MKWPAVILSILALVVAGCGSGNTEADKVWCVAPGEEVTPAFEREYPELYMTKDECEAAEKVAEKVFSELDE